jgi:hypothetical protein
MRMFCQKLFDVADFPAGTSTATDAVGCGSPHNVRKDQGYSIYVHVRWVLSGKYCSTGSVLGIIRLPRLPVQNCIKAQNEKKHWTSDSRNSRNNRNSRNSRNYRARNVHTGTCQRVAQTQCQASPHAMHPIYVPQ